MESETNTNSTPATVENTTAATSTTTPALPEKKKRGWLVTCLVVGALLLVCCCTLGGLATWFGVSSLDEAKKGLTNVICADKEDLESVYEDRTTDNLRRTLTQREFEDLVSQINSDCDSIENKNSVELISAGWGIDSSAATGSSTKVIFKGEMNDNTVNASILLVDSEYLLDSLEVE
jgi:hypothetical protein